MVPRCRSSSREDTRTTVTDELERARHGDASAFDALARTYERTLYSHVARIIRPGADAEDVVQDAYLRAYRYFDSFQGGEFRVWLLSIVRNSFLDWIKENRSSRLLFQAEPGADMDDTMWAERPRDPEALLLDSIDSQTLEQLMLHLPLEYREVLLLREVEDLSYKEIAAITTTPTGTVMSRLSRARLALRKLWLSAHATETAHGV